MAKLSPVERAIRDVNKRTMIRAFNEAEAYANEQAGIRRVPAALTIAEQDRLNRDADIAKACRQVPMFRELLCRHMVMQTQPCKQCGRTMADAQRFAVGLVDHLYGDEDEN